MEILKKLLKVKTSDEIVNEIHTKIDEAQAKLLKEAQTIVETNKGEKEVMSKAEKLKFLGLVKSPKSLP